MVKSAAALILLLSLAAPLPGQSTTAIISGTVKDGTGAVVPGADVSAKNQDTGVVRTTFSNEAGFYSIPNLISGVYAVSASYSGFKKSEIRDIRLAVAQDRLVDLLLEVGEITSVVEVDTAPPVVELRSGEVSNLVEARQVSELPLTGRNFMQLTLLVPGVSPNNNFNSRNTGLIGMSLISANGGSPSANLWLVDGADNVDRGGNWSILVYPSVDSIAEFRVSRSGFGPDAGAAAGAVVNVITKSGTNAFHGTAYEFFRNDALDGVNFFVPRRADGSLLTPGDKPALRSNDFGYTIGGPVRRDRAFFFWSQEWRKERRGITRTRLVPTAAERTGDFSGPFLTGNQPIPIDPTTGAPFPGNKIPANRLSPAGLSLMKLYRLPNLPLTSGSQPYNLVFSPTTPIETRQEQVRIDYQLLRTMSVMARYTQEKWENRAPNYGYEGTLWGDDGMAVVDSNWLQPSKSLAIQVTNSIGNSVVNQFQYSYSNNRIYIDHGIGEDIDREIVKAIPQVYPNARPDETHAMFWGAPGVGGNLMNAAPWSNGENLNVWKDDFSLAWRNHTMKMGYQMTRNWKDEDCCGQFLAIPQFWGPNAINWGDVPYTGNGLADALYKGTYWGATERSSQPRAKTRWRDFEWYWGDAWRVKPQLTLSYGFRWSILKNPFDADDAVANFVDKVFDPKLGAAYDNGLIYPDNLKGVSGVGSRSLAKEHYWNIGPRFGFAWDPTGSGRNSIRGGAGTYFNRPAIAQGWQSLNTNPPFSQVLLLGDGRPLDSLPAGIPAVDKGLPAWGMDISAPLPRTYQWNLTFEREIFKDTKLEIAYSGNKAGHLYQEMNLTQIPVQYRLQSQVDQLNGVSAEEIWRKYTPYGAAFGDNLISYWGRGADSSYNALQVYLVKRFTDRLTYNVAYTFSKIVSTSGLLSKTVISDNSNLRYDRGLPAYDRTHLFVVNGIYNLPKLEKHARFVRSALGDWEMTGIYSYNTGVPLTFYTGYDLSGTANQRADLVGDPGGPHTPQKWFNTGAVRIPTRLGALGNSSVGVSGERAPAINNLDISIYKNFAIPWVKSSFTAERAKIQFRAEFFNALNHTQFFPPDTSLSPRGVITDQSNPSRDIDAATGTVNIPVSKYSPTFGTINRARDPREIQFALKLIW